MKVVSSGHSESGILINLNENVNLKIAPYDMTKCMIYRSEDTIGIVTYGDEINKIYLRQEGNKIIYNDKCKNSICIIKPPDDNNQEFIIEGGYYKRLISYSPIKIKNCEIYELVTNSDVTIDEGSEITTLYSYFNENYESGKIVINNGENEIEDINLLGSLLKINNEENEIKIIKFIAFHSEVILEEKQKIKEKMEGESKRLIKSKKHNEKSQKKSSAIKPRKRNKAKFKEKK